MTKAQYNRLFAERPELDLLEWERLSKTMKRIITSYTEEQFVTACTADLLIGRPSYDWLMEEALEELYLVKSDEV